MLTPGVSHVLEMAIKLHGCAYFCVLDLICPVDMFAVSCLPADELYIYCRFASKSNSAVHFSAVWKCNQRRDK